MTGSHRKEKKKPTRAYPVNRSHDKKLLTLVQKQDSKCFYCGKLCSIEDALRFKKGYGATLDHVIPVTNKGGTTYKNLVMCCNWCNNRKGHMKLYSFQQQFFSEGFAGMKTIKIDDPVYPLMIRLLKPQMDTYPCPPYKP